MDLSGVIHPCVPLVPVPEDIDISQSTSTVPIARLARACGLLDGEFEPFGKYKAKVALSVLERLKDTPDGHYVLITGMTPTSLGEGKSTTTMGVGEALGAILHKNVFSNVRQPSMGPIFGIKGGAAGGGYAMCVPMEDFNLGLPDIHSVALANNLLAAAIDTRMFHEATQTDEQLFDRLFPVQQDGTRKMCRAMRLRFEKLGIMKTLAEDLTPEERSKVVRLDIDPAQITWQRVVDVNDRHLRGITIGQGPQEQGKTRRTGFDIAVASEVMAILALCRDIADLRSRLGRICIGFNRHGAPVTADDLGVAGAMCALLKESIMPNLMQTVEGTPVFVHCGPFANIAHGNSSILADRISLKLVGKDGYVLTEAGFGADIGLEKFFDIKCRYSGLSPSCVVMVATCRALKMHGGVKDLLMTSKPNMEALRAGLPNLLQHIENANKFGVPVVVSINRYREDVEEELAVVIEAAVRGGAFACFASSHWAKGGQGAVQVAEAVIRACEKDPPFKFLYPLEMSLKDKIITIATQIYRADGVDFPEEVEKRIKMFEDSGFGRLPVCMAKTPLSFTANPEIKGAPRGYRIKVRDIRASVGAGFVFPLLGDIMTLPGLPTRPAYYDVDIDPDGTIRGLF